MRNKQFEPRVVALLPGESVNFPNLDPVFHNVFSLSGKNRFDLGLYKDGASKTQSFPEPGVVRVFCNIHPNMTAYVLVLENPWFAKAGPDGRYAIRGVRPGAYALRAWDERGGETEERVEVRAGETARVDFELDATSYKRVPHKNKFGQPYSTSAY
jgi:hypothetical protein